MKRIPETRRAVKKRKLRRRYIRSFSRGEDQLMNDYKPEIVPIGDVPVWQRKAIWLSRFDGIIPGKAVMLRYNNRQRAHQVRKSIRGAAQYWKVKIYTRVIHAEKAIHDTDGWLVYFWKEEEKVTLK